MGIIKETDHQFYIGESPDNVSAQIEYSINGNVLSILSTDVSASLQGQGIGQQLVTYAVEFARKNHLKIIPICPYAKKQFEKHPEFNDVRVI